MTKGTGQKHFKREDHAHAAHQEEAAHPHDRDAVNKAESGANAGGAIPGPGTNPGTGAHPAEQPPKSPRKGQ